MKTIAFTLLAFAALLLVNCSGNKQKKDYSTLTTEEAKSLAKEAYIWGLPLPYIEVQIDRSTAVTKPEGTRAPLNQFAHFRKLPDASDRTVVGMNLDVLLSLANCNLAQEPLVMILPDIQDRFWAMQVLNAWNDVPYMFGTKASAGKGGQFIFTGPKYKGEIPAGLQELKMTTDMMLLGGRIRIEDVSQTPAINAIQDQIKLIPLSQWNNKDWKPSDVPVKTGVDGNTPVPQQVLSMQPQKFFSRLNALLADNLPYPADSVVLARIAKIGIIPGEAFPWDQFSPEVQAAIAEGAKEGFEEMKKTPMGENMAGWQMTRDMGHFGTKYALRAINTFVAVGGNPLEIAAYPMTKVDAAGNELDGTHQYRLHFQTPPPVDAFWSLYMYNNESFFVDNPLNRYMLGSRSKLKYERDGSLILAVQSSKPKDVPESNWLPAPNSGSFLLAMRLYSPGKEVIDGTWQPPAVQRVDK